ncbi:MAG: hypothetical protein ACI835_004591, partial [Planctomycetota bacterium]
MNGPGHIDPQQALAEAAANEGREHVFPRQLTSDLLAKAEKSEVRRGRVQAWVVAFGLLVLTLGLPIELPWGTGEWSRAIAGERGRDMLAWMGAMVASLTGLDADPAAYLLAAAFLALNCISIYHLLVKFGFEHYPALAGAVMAALAPLSFVSAASATAYGAGSLAACWLARALLSSSRDLQPAFIFPAYTLGWIFHWEIGLLLPAAWVALSGAPHWKRKRARSGLAVSGALWIARLIWLPTASTADWSLCGSGFLGLLGLGVLLGGMVSLFVPRATEEESGPPRWVLVWLGCGLIACLSNPIDAGPVGVSLLPIGAIGLADWISRQSRPDLALRIGVGSLSAQLLLTVGATPLLRWRLGSELPWVDAARAQLEPADLVVVSGP